MVDETRMKLGNILRNFHQSSPHPVADDGDVEAAIDAVIRTVGRDGGFDVPEHLQPTIRNLLKDEQVTIFQAPPLDIQKIIQMSRDSARGTIIGVDFAEKESVSVEAIYMPREWYDELKRREQDLLEANNRYLDRARAGEAGERTARDQRQTSIMAWAHKAFGGIEGFDPCSIEERGRRFLEEALELVQAIGMQQEDCQKVVDYVFLRPAGDPFQEVGGVTVTLACLAEVIDVSVCNAEIAEFDRVQSKTKEHFEARQRAKMEAGL